MYREFYYGITVLAVLGIAISFLLTPSEKELALMNLEDKNYEYAFEKYKNLIKKGDMSVSVVMPLSKLYIQYGDIKSAISLIESFVKIHPESFDAKRELGILYKYSQQPDDYLANLENIYKLKPSAEILRELSDIYNYNAQYQKQIIILNDLLYNSKYNAQEKDFMNLAYLYGTQGDYKSAIDTLDYLLKSKDFQVDIGVLNLLVSLLIDNKQDEEVIVVASRYIEKNNKVTSKEIARVSEIIREKNKPKLALEFLNPYLNNLNTSSDILTEFINLQLTLNYKKIITGYEKDIPDLVTSILENKEIRFREKRHIAYMLLEINMVKDAERLFFQIAENAPSSSPDVEQLFYLWGSNISDKNLKWAEDRALSANGEELAYWLKYLNDAKYYEAAIFIAESHINKDKEAVSRYLEAIALSGNKEKMSEILEKEIGKEFETQYLRTLAKFAIEADLNNIAEIALTKLIKVSPNEAMAVQYLSKLKYFKGSISEAKNILVNFLNNNKGNYEINYYYGEILWSEKRFEEARSYFQIAYNQIIKSRKGEFIEEFLEANILLRLNKTKKAVAKFKNLVKKYPDNKHLKADYVNLLMEIGDYEGANRILGDII